MRVGTRLAALEMIESGTTTFADMYYFEDDIAEVTRAAGLRAVLGQSVIKFPVADAATPEEALARAEAFIDEVEGRPAGHAGRGAARALHARAGDPAGRARAGEQVQRAAADSPRGDQGRGRHDHRGRASGARRRATSKRWACGTADRWRRTPCGSTTADMEMLGERGVGLAHNPESNMKLASGVARRARLAGAGHPRRAGHRRRRQQQRPRHVRGDAHGGAAAQGRRRAIRGRCRREQALELATRRGAEALGLGDRIGSLEAGQAGGRHHGVDVSGARQTPMFDPISHLVYVSREATMCRTTMVAGRVLMTGRGGADARARERCCATRAPWPSAFGRSRRPRAAGKGASASKRT